MSEQKGRLVGNLRRAGRALWWIGIAAVLILALVGASTVYAEVQPKPLVDEYAQLRRISFLQLDVLPPDGKPDLTIMVTKVTVFRNVDDGTFSLLVEGGTTPPLASVP